MKKRKGNLLQRMMAVFLSAVLVAGTVAGAVPTEVFAAENTAGIAEEETSVEPLGETVSGNDAAGVQSEETVSGNDAAGAQPEGTQPQELSMLQNLEMQTDFYAVSDFSALKTLIEAARGELVIRLPVGTISMTETISVPQESTVTLLADGGDCILKRADGFAGEMFLVNGTLKLGNAEDGSGKLILDGGAVWKGEVDAILGRGTENSGIKASSSLLIGAENSKIYIYPSALLQNNDYHDNADRGAYGGAVTLYNQGAELYLYGGSITNNASSNGGGAVKTYEGASVKMTGGEISGNYAGTHGGAFQIYSGKAGAQNTYTKSVCEITGGSIQGNLCNRYGGAIAVSDHSSLSLSGNVQIINNKTNNSNGSDLGGGIAFGDSDTTLSLAGDVVVSGNMRGEETNNLHIGQNNNKITIGALSDSAQIGVTMKAGTGDFSNACDTDRKSCFFSDKSDYKVVSGEGNVLSLAEAQTDDNIASGTGWVLDKDGVLTIQNDTGMAKWIENGRETNGSQVKQAVLQNGVTRIGSDDRYGMPGDRESGAFSGCSNLKSITIPGSVSRIGSWAFSGCSNLASIAIPSGVSSIGEASFENCSSLTSIAIPSGVTEIEGSTFSGCSGLTDVTIPSGVTHIGSSAFSGCSSLTGITIPNSVTSIANNVFCNCSSLTSITIPSGLEKIYYSLFEGCSSLTSIEIPSGVTQIDSYAFKNCSRLKSITIPDSVTTIGFQTFQNCSNLTSIAIPSGVTTIAYQAFCGCSSLNHVTMQGTIPPTLGNEVFGNCKFVTDNTQGIHVPEGCVDTYKASWTAWADYIKKDADTHSLSLVPEKAATCAKEGNKAYYTCSHCNNWYEFGDGTGVILNHASVVIPRKAHTYSATEYKYDKNGHWQKCIVCQGESARTSHSLGEWETKKPATASEDGSKERSCTCGYKETETIPKTGGETSDPGKIETDKKQGENTPEADFGMSNDDLISAVLKQEEKDLVAAGTDIKIVLDIDNIDASVEPSDKQAVTDKAGEYTVGQYLDISLYKIINDNDADKEKISQTTGKIRIVLTIPDSLKNTDSGKTRSYAVVRVHDGAAELLADIDNDEATITIETDLFSTYALVYKETANTGDQNPDDGGNSDSGNNGDSSGSGNSGDNTDSGNSGDNTDSGNSDSDGNEDNSSDNGSDSDTESDSDTDNDNHTADAKKDNEPKTGDTTPIEIYATLAMVAGLSYLILLFGNRKMGMTEQEKKELTAALVAWGRKGGKLRRAAALAVIFLILVYYHSIGKKICVEWKEVYGE